MAYTGFYSSSAEDNIIPSTDVSTSGTVTKSGISVSLKPPSDSTAVYFGHKAEMLWANNNSLLAPGWITGHESVVSLTGNGNVYKVVGNMSQFNNLLTGGNTTIALGYEAVISYMDPTAHVQNYVGFYVPNASVVPNIGNIQQYSAFQSDYTEAKNSFLHPTYGAAQQDLAPAPLVAPVPGRFYSSDHTVVNVAGLSPNITYYTPVLFGGRFNVTRVGIQSAATPGAKVKLALYNAQGLNANALVADFGEIDVSAGGPVEITVNQRVEAGMYYLAVKANIAVPVLWHSGSSLRASQYGQSSPALSGAAQEVLRIDSTSAYADSFPAGAFSMSTVSHANGEPHLWYRMGV